MIPSLLMSMLLAGAVNSTVPARLRACNDERTHPPYLTEENDGLVDQLVQQAARESGMDMDLQKMPLMRCRELLRAGAVDAVPNLPYAPQLMPHLVWPMLNGQPDTSRMVAQVRNYVFRRIGSRALWDGKRFSQLGMPVLLTFGSIRITEKARQLQLPYDDGGKSARINFAKLAAGRAELVIAFEHEGQALMALPEFAGKIEMLPGAFTEEAYYFAFQRNYYAANKDAAERMWAAIARIRATPAYLQLSNEVLARPIPAPKD